ncbi:glycosyltransferase family 4 protein [Geomonas ferrireducens]|uniref:glycosyltransferase family 4 protein n=1 Tax=Geomonas ferrireducens TaxID=2570227 RepID=UPI0013A5E671|nr:glycosyltransferase family 4 protein [Geomonas ferrireducens]
MKKIIVTEGWRFVPHSYACVNMWQCLELIRRDDVELYHRDLPYLKAEWTPSYRLFDAESTAALGALKAPDPAVHPEVLYRIDYPCNLAPVKAQRHFVFGTTEHGVVRPTMLAGNGDLPAQLAASDAVIVTPSNWSRAGFLRSGAPEERVIVVPHGVREDIFRPFAAADRDAVRKQMGWGDEFVVLSIGTMIGNKGIRYLLKAFAVVQQRYPRMKLCLKGLDGLYPSQKCLKECGDLLTREEAARLQASLVYIGETLSFHEMAALYNACDLYASPYMAEGFNLPVLEAAACGLPVICTAGGPTDDFIDDSFADRIASTPLHAAGGVMGLDPSLEHLVALLARTMERGVSREVKEAAAGWVRERYTWRHAVDKLLAAFFAR